MGRILATPYTTGELMSWFDPSGNEYPLNGDAYLFLDGRKGFKGLPPMQAYTLETPLTDGNVSRFVLAKARPLEVHLLVKGGNITDFEQVRRVLQNAMNPKLGTGFFRCMAADGSLRDVNCQYVDGFAGDETWGVSSPQHEELILGFDAHDPYFYDTTAQVLPFTASAATAFFPILPLKLSSSALASGNFSIFNAGDVEAFPVFTIAGPGTNPTLTNNTTGKAIAATITLTAGQSLIIDTQAKAVKREDGSNQFSTLSFASVLWTLATGNNLLNLTMSGTGAGSQITVSYKNRWNGL